MEPITGAEILVRCLKEEGVEYLFGYPGGSVLHIYDELYKQEDINQSWSATNRPPFTPPTAIPAPAASPAWYWSPPALASPMP